MKGAPHWGQEGEDVGLRGQGLTGASPCPVCEGHGAGGADLCHLLAALPPLLHPGQLPKGYLLPQVHPAGLPGTLLAGHELHHVQPHHLLLSEPQVSPTLALYPRRGLSCTLALGNLHSSSCWSRELPLTPPRDAACECYS